VATYGLEKTLRAIYKNQADRILVSDDSGFRVRQYKCGECTSISFSADNRCQLCQSENISLLEEKPLEDAMLDLAIEKNIEYVPVSGKSAEGKQFLMGFQGIGAFLRYR